MKPDWHEIRVLVTAPGELIRHPPDEDHPVWVRRLPGYHDFYCYCAVAGERADVEAFIANPPCPLEVQ